MVNKLLTKDGGFPVATDKRAKIMVKRSFSEEASATLKRMKTNLEYEFSLFFHCMVNRDTNIKFFQSTLKDRQGSDDRTPDRL